MSTWQDVLTLVGESTTGTNSIGDPITGETTRDIFGKMKDISQNEFYQARAQGLRPAFKFEVHLKDYQAEKVAIYQSTRYDIIRTYRVNYDRIELTLQGVVNSGAVQ